MPARSGQYPPSPTQNAAEEPASFAPQVTVGCRQVAVTLVYVVEELLTTYPDQLALTSAIAVERAVAAVAATSAAAPTASAISL